MYVFGGATSDRIEWAVSDFSIFGATRTGIFTCWVLPTTLTATRRIMSTGVSNWALQIDTTTSQLRIVGDAATDGVWTVPVGFTVNTPTFLAVAWSTSTTAAVWRVWSGGEADLPVERTVTVATAMSGTMVEGDTTLTIGNLGAGTTAFQGSIGGIAFFQDVTTNVASTTTSMLATATITQDQADQVYRRFVVPLWKGDIARFAGSGRRYSRLVTPSGFVFASSLDQSGAPGMWFRGRIFGTVVGATYSARATPHSWSARDDYLLRAAPGGRTRRGFVART